MAITRHKPNEWSDATKNAVLAKLLSNLEGILAADGAGALTVAKPSIDYMRSLSVYDMDGLGEWTEFTEYVEGDIIAVDADQVRGQNDGTAIMVCVTAHESSSVFINDAINWRFLFCAPILHRFQGILKGTGYSVTVAKEGVDYPPIVINPDEVVDNTAIGPKISLMSGDNLSIGKVCYMDATGKMKRGDADSIATGNCWAMALEYIPNGNTGQFALANSIVCCDGWELESIGKPVYLDTEVVGNITQTLPVNTGNIVQVIGIAIEATKIYFNPQLVTIELS